MTRAVLIAGQGALLATFVLMACGVSAQNPHQTTERENWGFHGPVRSALTVVHKLNPDPRPADKRKLELVQNADWKVFDVQGRTTEFATSADADRIVATAKCTYAVDGARHCTNDPGPQYQVLTKEIVLPDGSHQITSYLDSKLLSTKIALYDSAGREVSYRFYDDKGKLVSEGSVRCGAGTEVDVSKMYEKGSLVSHTETWATASTIERREFAADGHVLWYLQLDDDGELISSWYKVGYKPRMGSQASLGIMRPDIWVIYKFDEQGSGRLEKTVIHMQENSKPHTEEHYGFDGLVDEKCKINVVFDAYGNWTSRSVFVWEAKTNQMVETEEDTRKIEYY